MKPGYLLRLERRHEAVFDDAGNYLGVTLWVEGEIITGAGTVRVVRRAETLVTKRTRPWWQFWVPERPYSERLDRARRYIDAEYERWREQAMFTDDVPMEHKVRVTLEVRHGAGNEPANQRTSQSETFVLRAQDLNHARMLHRALTHQVRTLGTQEAYQE